jgi:protein-glutamine gamma-glutamyltransferase
MVSAAQPSHALKSLAQTLTRWIPRGHESQQLFWSIGVLALALLPHIANLPIWIPILALACGSWRVVIELRGWRLPPKWLRIIISITGIVTVATTFRTLNGLDAGTTLLATMASIKLLETRGRRDCTVLIFIGYVLAFAALLYDQSLLRLPLIIIVSWLLTATLLRIHDSSATLTAKSALRRTGIMVLQALPVTALLFIFFPRLPGQFWALPSRETAATGLSDSMTPGDISELTISGAIAFRVQFDGAVPPLSQRYWRGPVLHDFDGRTWRSDRGGFFFNTNLKPKGQAYSYRLTMEPTQRNWLLALDTPTQWPNDQALRLYDGQLIARRPITALTSMDLSSHTQVEFGSSLPNPVRRRDIALPQDSNPRTRELAERLRSQFTSDSELVQSVLQKFRDEQFFYTLQPPTLGDNAVDEFLFDTRRGFCEHFASAFTVLMRAAGIPSRVVTGYQGGEYNELGDYLLIRQSDAHAWSEVWLDKQGWVRVDPTAAVAPQRVERNLSAALGANEPVPGRFVNSVRIFAKARLAWDAVNKFWNDRIVDYNELKQKSLMEWLGIHNPDWRDLGIGFAGTLIVFLAILSIYFARLYRPSSRDPAAKLYDVLCIKLSKRNLPREPHEGPQQYLRRAASTLPAHANQLALIAKLYIALRYQPQPTKTDLTQLKSLVRQI